MVMATDGYFVEDDPITLDFEAYPAISTESLLREIAPTYRGMSDAAIADDLEDLFAGMSAEDIEGFFSSLGRIAKRAGRTLVRAAPSILPVVGGAVGTLVGGPAGTAIGGALGRVAGSAIGRVTSRGQSRSRSRARPRSRARLQARTRRRAAPSRRRSAGRAPATPSPAIAQRLLSLVQNPAFLQSLVGRVIGDAEASTVRVGEAQVAAPFGAFMNALETLAQEAAAEAHVSDGVGSGLPEYLVDEYGEAVVEVEDSEARAEHLLRLLDEEQWVDESVAEYDGFEDAGFESDYDEALDEAEAVGLWLEEAGLSQRTVY